MTDELINQKFDNFVAFLKANASKIDEYKKYEDKEALKTMVIQYLKPAYIIGQLKPISEQLCVMLGITCPCKIEKTTRYLEFFSQAL